MKIPDDEFVLRNHSEYHVDDPMNNEDDFSRWKEESNSSPVHGLNVVPNQRQLNQNHHSPPTQSYSMFTSGRKMYSVKKNQGGEAKVTSREEERSQDPTPLQRQLIRNGDKEPQGEVGGRG